MSYRLCIQFVFDMFLFAFLDESNHDHLPDFINEDAGEKMKFQVKRKGTRKMNSYLVVFRKVNKFNVLFP